MFPSTHLIVSLILAAILFPFVGINSLIIIVGGVLIDLDHVIYYWIRFKDINLKNAYNYCKNIAQTEEFKKKKKVFMLFHSVEFIAIIIILSFYYTFLWMLVVGIIVHLIMDIIYELSTFKTMVKSLSLIAYLKHVKKQNKK
ncbi:MAG: hypothetical protein KKC75_04920 [Nanoarchaeota archaeon]|nr:hypothetical protein [Nanoarchaeota archaeon]MBU1004567.1 hypothetical protein [Nanoarchaeota archaeon]